MKRYAVIVAGGSGTRMGGEIPKQFLPLRHRPVLMYTLEAFHHFDTEIDIILVLPAAQFSYWTKLCQQHSFSVPFRLTAGGTTRFHSVRNGLERINAHDGIVGIHDGVRPLVSPETLGRCYREAEKKQLRHSGCTGDRFAAPDHRNRKPGCSAVRLPIGPNPPVLPVRFALPMLQKSISGRSHR